MTSVALCLQAKSFRQMKSLLECGLPDRCTLSPVCTRQKICICSLRFSIIAMNMRGIEAIILELFLNRHVFLPNSKNISGLN